MIFGFTRNVNENIELLNGLFFFNYRDVSTEYFQHVKKHLYLPHLVNTM